MLAAAPFSIPFHLDESRPQHRPRPLRVPASYLRQRPPEPPPAVSIVTPALDAAAFIQDAMDSVLGQGYPRLEYVVMDGGSADGTVQLVERRRDRLAHVESGPDGGPAQAINRGIEATSGEIMGWLNADDLLLPGSLAHVTAYLAAHPDVDMVYGNRILIDEGGEEVGIWVTPPHGRDSLSWFGFVPQETAFWRRSLWDRVGGLDESLRLGFDWDLFLRFDRAGARIERLPRFLGGFRIHSGQLTRTSQPDALAELARIRATHHGRPMDLHEAKGQVDGFRARSLAHHAWQRARRCLAPRARVGSGMAGKEL